MMGFWCCRGGLSEVRWRVLEQAVSENTTQHLNSLFIRKKV